SGWNKVKKTRASPNPLFSSQPTVVEKTNPSVYQLEDPNRTICLVTDFKPEDNETSLVSSSVSGSRMFTGKVTAVDMKSTYSKSMGMLVWSNTRVPCNATIVEKGFETDIHLNYQNLNVIVLRVLLLKMAGFNLLMTVRLWSS
ncbi:T-cell receptor alpha chain C region, partial [Galemys pyrenaicus]